MIGKTIYGVNKACKGMIVGDTIESCVDCNCDTKHLIVQWENGDITHPCENDVHVENAYFIIK